MEAIEIQKELMKSKVDATFSHYKSGKLYYMFTIKGGTIFRFPIETVEQSNKSVTTTISINDVIEKKVFEIDDMILSQDLGETTFDATVKATLLWRWIKKSIADKTLEINYADESFEFCDISSLYFNGVGTIDSY